MTMRNRWWAAPILAGGAALLAACGSSGSPSTSTSTPATSGAASSAATSPQGSGSSASTVTIMTHSTSKGTVLTNAQGKTLYWFAIDTPTKSNCNGSCTSFWPPVIGKAAAVSGTTLMHGFGTITRSDGSVQATYDGHPLYTYAADTAPGQIGGNALNVSGGLWWAMTPSGAKLGGAAPSGSSSSSSGGGGYGY
jgi:predicted lipoprotein with Yx(FWY)xxD motif